MKTYTIDRIWHRVSDRPATDADGLVCTIWASALSERDLAGKEFFGPEARKDARAWAHRQGAVSLSEALTQRGRT